MPAVSGILIFALGAPYRIGFLSNLISRMP